MSSLHSYLLLAVCTVLLWKQHVCTETAEGRLAVLHNILRDHSPLVRPDGESTETSLSVSISYSLFSIGQVDMSSGRFDTTGYLILGWKDPRLAFSSSQAASVRVDPDDIWTPDIELYNAAAPGWKILNRKNLAVVFPTGEVTWIPQVSMPSICDLTTTNMEGTFNCTLRFGSWTYNGFEMDITVPSSKVDMDNYIPNRRWEVVNTSANREVMFYSCCPEPYPSAAISFVIRPKEDGMLA